MTLGRTNHFLKRLETRNGFFGKVRGDNSVSLKDTMNCRIRKQGGRAGVRASIDSPALKQ